MSDNEQAENTMETIDRREEMRQQLDSNIEAIADGKAVAIRINPVTDPVVRQYTEEAERLLRWATERTITEDGHVKDATDDLSILSKLSKSIEVKRQEYVGPINSHLKAINEAFKSVTMPIDNAITLTKRKILDYKTEQQVKADAIKKANDMRMEAARIEAQANGTGEISHPIVLTPEPEIPAKTITSNLSATSTVKVKKWRLVDIHQVPEEYLKVDEAAIGKLVRAGIKRIPGIEIYEEETLRVNAR
jgi:hypothetical protein